MGFVLFGKDREEWKSLTTTAIVSLHHDAPENSMHGSKRRAPDKETCKKKNQHCQARLSHIFASPCECAYSSLPQRQSQSRSLREGADGLRVCARVSPFLCVLGRTSAKSPLFLQCFSQSAFARFKNKLQKALHLTYVSQVYYRSMQLCSRSVNEGGVHLLMTPGCLRDFFLSDG